MDKLYAGLKDLAEERQGRLRDRLRLTQLKREVDDLEQWVAEREVVAGSHELGQDYEHVTVSPLHRFIGWIPILGSKMCLRGSLKIYSSTTLTLTTLFGPNV